jgi:hypothetical protein
MTWWANRNNDKAKPFVPHNFDTKVTYAKIPSILIAAKAYNDMYILVDEADNFYIGEVYLIKQECSAAQTELDDGAIGDLGNELLLQDGGMEIVNSLRFWGHSHVRMGTSPSGQDESQLKHFIENDCDYFIRAILNKDGKIEFTLRYRNGFEIKDVPWMVLQEVDETGRTEWKKQIKDKVKAYVYTSPAQSGYGANGRGKSQDLHPNYNRGILNKAGSRRTTRSGAKSISDNHSEYCQCIHCQMDKAGVDPSEYVGNY